MHLEESKKVLRESDLFKDLNEIHLDLVLMACEEISYEKGEFLFHQNDPGDAVYIIARGEVEIILEPKHAEDDEICLAAFDEANTFGEVILVQESHRTASARTKSDAQLIRIPRQRLLKLCHDYPEIGFHIMYRIAAELARKLGSSNINMREQVFSRNNEEEENAAQPAE